MDGIISRKQYLEGMGDVGYLGFRIILTVILSVTSIKLAAEQHATGVSGIVSPSFFVGSFAAVANVVMAFIAIISKGKAFIPARVLTTIDIILVIISLAAFILSVTSIISMTNQQTDHIRRNVVLAGVDVILLILDVFQLASGLIRASRGDPQNLTLGVTAPGQAGEEVEMDSFAEDGEDGDADEDRNGEGVQEREA